MPAKRVFWWSPCMEVGTVVVENINDPEEKIRKAREDHRNVHPYCSKPTMILDIRFVLMTVLPFDVAHKIADILETPKKVVTEGIKHLYVCECCKLIDFVVLDKNANGAEILAAARIDHLAKREKCDSDCPKVIDIPAMLFCVETPDWAIDQIVDILVKVPKNPKPVEVQML